MHIRKYAAGLTLFIGGVYVSHQHYLVETTTSAEAAGLITAILFIYFGGVLIGES